MQSLTTIAYDHKKKEIAVDSRVTVDGKVCSDDAVKFTTDNGITFFFAGRSCDQDWLVRIYNGEHIANNDYRPDGLAVIASPDGVSVLVVTSDNEPRITKINWCDAWGSGCDWAVAAMDFGKSAESAVDYAKRRDCYTGGHVHIFDLNSMRFK